MRTAVDKKNNQGLMGEDKKVCESHLLFKSESCALSRSFHAGNCDICNSGELIPLYPMEMMHGVEGPFLYVHCQNCGSTYQPEKLNDYSKYYSDSYYSFQYKEPNTFNSILRKFKRRLRNRYFYFSTGLLGRMLAFLRPKPINHLSHHITLRFDMEILEIGSGSGELLHEIADLGVKKVVGIDPFVPNDIAYKNNARIYKASIDQLGDLFGQQKFDLIMFNHSLEHTPTPFEDLGKASKFLKSNGEILLRFPISGSKLSDYYGENWWSLDAPRHIYLFSSRSVELLAKQCNLKVKRTHYEGTVDDYLASEQHVAGIALLNAQSYVVNPKSMKFTPRQLEQYNSEIETQNKLGTAAQAGFILGF
jgi:2-polyprenyl-3-methyl-5-hydroxy-6-metoxy-1,4-benzoquinol methylase